MGLSLTPSPFAPATFPQLPEVRGLAAATGSAGFYAKRGIERDDVFLCVFDPQTSAAGVFTRSLTASDDVGRCRAALKAGGGRARALIVHAGNSNAFTGPLGVAKNDATLAALTELFGAPASQSFLAATGVIGAPLQDVDRIARQARLLKGRLGPPDFAAMARAFMTTDTYPKGAGARVSIGGAEVRLAGIAKGSGMIAPDMATMLAYVFTDAAISPEALQTLVARTVDLTFNAITVDGDTSTSDTFMTFATGASGAPRIDDLESPEGRAFAAAFHDVVRDLAFQIVKDGEGAQKFVAITVTGAASDVSARAVAASIANSPLVKTALAASDANWGRIVAAAGKAGEPLARDRLSVRFCGLEAARDGGPSPDYDEAEAMARLKAREIDIAVDLGVGEGAATVWTCDLTHAYIDINGAYRT